MKNLICIFLFLGGCATIPTQNEFYHRFAVKPSIIEQDLGNGQKRETVTNPYDVTIIVDVDCDNEQMRRQYTIKNGRTVSFDTTSDTDHNCSPISWVVK